MCVGTVTPGFVLSSVGGACGLSRCSIYWLFVPSLTPPPLPPRGNGLRAAINFWCGPDPPHMWDMSSLNERRRFATAAVWYCNLILVFSVGQREKVGRRGTEWEWERKKKELNKKILASKPYPLLFFLKLPVLTSRMFYLGPQCARTAFTVLTVARCASAGTVPVATTSQEPACAPPAGQDHTAFWVMEATSLKQGVREALTAAHHDILSLNSAMKCLWTIISIMRHCQWLF